MLGLSQEQIMGLLRQILPLIGGMAVAMGWLTTDQVGKYTQFILQIAGPIMVGWGVIWSFFANSKSSLITKVADLDEVKNVVLDSKQPDSIGINSVTPPNVTMQ